MRSATELARLVGVLQPPIHRFVAESNVRLALLITTSGQVLAQHGFGRGIDLAAVASLAAASHAASRKLAELSGQERWSHLHNAAVGRELFLAPLQTADEELILVSIFDEETSLGIVQLYFADLVEQLSTIDDLRQRAPSGGVATFERDLEAGLERVFPHEQHWSH